MHSLIFRVRVTTRCSMDEMERPRCRYRRARSRRVDFIAGEGSLRRHSQMHTGQRSRTYSDVGRRPTFNCSNCNGNYLNWSHYTFCRAYIRQGGHHVGHWPTFLVCCLLFRLFKIPEDCRRFNNSHGPTRQNSTISWRHRRSESSISITFTTDG